MIDWLTIGRQATATAQVYIDLAHDSIWTSEKQANDHLASAGKMNAIANFCIKKYDQNKKRLGFNRVN
jgi:hypothetical protein